MAERHRCGVLEHRSLGGVIKHRWGKLVLLIVQRDSSVRVTVFYYFVAFHSVWEVKADMKIIIYVIH